MTTRPTTQEHTVSAPAVKIGDPDPTPDLDEINEYCWAPHRLSDRELSVYCSWRFDHEGDHVSADVGVGVVAVWSGAEPPPGRVWSPRDQRPWVFGARGGRSPEQWTDAMAEEGWRIGVRRQCSIGWHDECSDPAGESCRCACHAQAEAIARADHGITS